MLFRSRACLTAPGPAPQGADGSLVRGHDRNTSAVHLSVTMRAGPPYVPWWEARPDWILYAARAAIAAWGLLGAAIWLREARASPPAPPPPPAAAAAEKKRA